MAPNGSTGADELTPATATTIPTAMGKADAGPIIYAPGEYFRNLHAAATTKSINHLAAAPCVKLTCWNNTGSQAWVNVSGHIYSTSRSGTNQIVDVYNQVEWTDKAGRVHHGRTVFEKKADLDSITGPGQWAIVGFTVYAWCIGDTDLTITAPPDRRQQIRLVIGGVLQNGELYDPAHR